MELVDKLLIGRKLARMDTYLIQVREFSKISRSSILPFFQHSVLPLLVRVRRRIGGCGFTLVIFEKT